MIVASLRTVQCPRSSAQEETLCRSQPPATAGRFGLCILLITWWRARVCDLVVGSGNIAIIVVGINVSSPGRLVARFQLFSFGCFLSRHQLATSIELHCPVADSYLS